MEKSIKPVRTIRSRFDVQNSNGTVNAQAIYSGEIVCAHPKVLKFGQNTFTPSSTTHNRWWNCYKQIRQAMIFWIWHLKA